MDEEPARDTRAGSVRAAVAVSGAPQRESGPGGGWEAPV